jgi:hypothetical protein
MKDFWNNYSNDGSLIWGGYFFSGDMMAGGGEADSDFVNPIQKAISLPKYNDLSIREATFLNNLFSDLTKLKKTTEGEYYVELDAVKYNRILMDLEKKGYGYIIGDSFTAKDKLFEFTHAVRMFLERKNNPDSQMAGGGKTGIPERHKNMGFSKVGQKKKSTRPKKKWMVLAKKGDKYKVVHGGEKGMKDFSQHRDKDRQKRFWLRMGGFDSERASDPFSPLYWHKKFGTWEDGGALEEEI